MDLCVIIPARNELFLANTLQDVLAHMEADTEIIAVLDGAPALTELPTHPRLRVIELQESIGQRAATNLAARQTEAKYLMKLDAHCAVEQGFDRIMLQDMQEEWTAVPVMKNLHAFNWLCSNGHRRYQGPSGPCTQCGEPTEREIVWIAKKSPNSMSYCFDAEPHFQYFREYSKRPEAQGNLTETMSLQGSCFMCSREKYWELELCDESFGTWGSQGIEVACKTWLSGGRVMVNHHTWYAHMFRTQGGDFGFPFPLSGSQVDHAKRRARELFFNNAWPKQVRPLSWLVERFWPVKGWTEEDLAKVRESAKVWEAACQPRKSILYYTDNRLDPQIMDLCQKQLLKAGLPIVSVSLKSLDFGQNIVLDAERGPLTMFRQILMGLEASTADVVFLCEHDVAYHPSHFDFMPEERNKVYYNVNIWDVRASDGHALYHKAKRTSQICAYRDVLLNHYRKRVAMVEANGYDRRMGYEPATHGRPERVDDLESGEWMSPVPNMDIKHGQNLTPSRWQKSDFRNQRYTEGWQEAEVVPGWGPFQEVLHGL